MIKSKKVDYVLLAFKQGYRVSEKGYIISFTGKILAGRCNNKGGYLVFNIRDKNKPYKQQTYSVKVHKLAAYQWFGERALEKEISVRHLNGNPSDNSKQNLAIGSHSDNMMDISEEKRIARAYIAAKKLRKLSEEEVVQLREDRKNGLTYKDLMVKYHIAKGTVSYIVNRRTYDNVK